MMYLELEIPSVIYISMRRKIIKKIKGENNGKNRQRSNKGE